MRLSIALGIPSFEIEQWPVEVFEEYFEYYTLEPFGAGRDNWHAAQIAHIIALANTPKNRKPPDFELFMYRDPETVREAKIKEADTFFAGAVSGRFSKTGRVARGANGKVPKRT